MAQKVVVPAVGESVQEGMIYKWHKQDGEAVSVDDVLLELETDKATVEIVSEYAGQLKILRKEGETVKVGDVLAEVDAAAQGAKAAEPAKGTETKPEAAASAPPPPPVDSGKSSPMAATLSPAVNRIVSERGINPSDIQATGPKGRITKEDALNHAPSAPSKSSAPVEPIVSLTAKAGRDISRRPMSMMRRKIAERLLQAQQTNAILTTFNEVDMGPVMELRKQYKDKFKDTHGIGLGFMSFFVKASIEALKQFPMINGYIDGTDIVEHNYYDIGVAISTDRGLMVPVIRDADSLSFAGVEKAIVDYAEKARAGKIALDDLSGGTFTITNGGVFGSLVSTPIINPPQSAILGMHKIQERPMAIKGEVKIRPMMYLAVSYDHRIIDGKEAVSFLVKIKDCLEDPSRMLLGV
jgi:2-oxoglutarate dehydrogenase E2 component (dihydrolipoamide succinyltransferase)